MRSLFVLRHGKSDRDSPASGDHDRPLKPRGRRAAKQVGRLLTALECTPGVVMTSSALRARSTAQLAHAAGEWNCPVEPRDELYLASASTLLWHAHRIAPSIERALFVGHEPGLSEWIGLLTDGTPPRFPTAALARIDLDGLEWKELAPGSCQLVSLVTPRSLEDG